MKYKRRETFYIKKFFYDLKVWYYKIPDVGLAQKPFDAIAYFPEPKKIGNFTIPKGLHAFEFKQKGRNLLPHQTFHLNKTKGYIVWWWKDSNRINFSVETITNYIKRKYAKEKGNRKEDRGDNARGEKQRSFQISF